MAYLQDNQAEWELYFADRAIPEPNSGCLLWEKSVNDKGYVAIGHKSRIKSANRLSWHLWYGPIPQNMCVLHKCDVRCCVNPRHLFIGTQADNVADMMAKGRVHDGIGTRNGRAKLNDESIREIRRLAPTMTRKDLGGLFGISHGNVCNIVSGRRWGHVE